VEKARNPGVCICPPELVWVLDGGKKDRRQTLDRTFR